MAKKKTKKTVKQKTWYAEYSRKRNAQRRAAYRASPEYREKVLNENRAQYRKRNGGDSKDCRDNLSRLDEIGTVRFLQSGNRRGKKVLTFTNEEMAQAIGYSLVALYRMQGDGRMPKPVTQPMYQEGPSNSSGAQGKFVTDCVYTEAEAIAVINELGAHQENVMHYRVSHVETRKRIFAAVKQARQKG